MQEANKSHKFTKSVYPGERTTIRIGGEKAMSSITASLYQNWGREIAKKLYADKGLIPTGSFELVDWEALKDAMSGLPRMYQVWVTKHTSGFSGTHSLLSRIDSTVVDRCWSCGKRKET